MCLILAIQAAGRNGYTPFPGLDPFPNPDTEVGSGIGVAHAGGETHDTSFPFHSRPCDGRPRQRVEGITFKRRFARRAGRENDDYRLVVHDPTLRNRA